MEVLAIIMGNPFFAELRTKQQAHMRNSLCPSHAEKSVNVCALAFSSQSRSRCCARKGRHTFSEALSTLAVNDK